MQEVLGNADIGGFEVVPLINPDVGEMRACISDTFEPLRKDDLALLYFTGHGIKDLTDNFYLTTAQSKLFENGRLSTGTAVEAEFIKQVLRFCGAERKVVVLDCCFGAAFADGFLTMDDGSMDVEAQLGGKGWCVMTAATSRRYALEQPGEELSVYTRYLVKGLQTGGAALDGREFVSVRHWHDYVKKQVIDAAPEMEPAIFNGQAGDNIWVAKARVDNAQRYRKRVQKMVREGRINAPARMELRQHWQPQLGIMPELAKEIEEEVLRPHREKLKHLAYYADALKEEKAEKYPFSDAVIEAFRSLQKTFGLTDEDVQAEEEKILGERMRAVSSSPATELKAYETLEKVSEYSTFSFKTVRVNERGEEVEKIPGRAEYFTEALGNGVELEMVRIPGGKFLMGAAKGEEGASEDEYPQHEVTVPEFWMGKFAVTQAQWAAVAAMEKVERDLKKYPASFKGAKRPVEQVSWEEAVEFCKRLSRRSKWEYTLPSEAQWEYACRARTTTPFHFGPTITTDLANYGGEKTTVDVGNFPANGFGLHDMHGNVWEWCLDGWHDNYKGAPTDGSSWESSSDQKVLRGGSWDVNPFDCRAANRGWASRDLRIYDIGFRVVSFVAPRT